MSIISKLHSGHKKNWFFISTIETKLLESNKYTTMHAIYQHFLELIEQAVIQLCPNLFLNFPAAAELQVHKHTFKWKGQVHILTKNHLVIRTH